MAIDILLFCLLFTLKAMLLAVAQLWPISIENELHSEMISPCAHSAPLCCCLLVNCAHWHTNVAGAQSSKEANESEARVLARGLKRTLFSVVEGKT